MSRFLKLFSLPAILVLLALPAQATITLSFQAEDLLQGGNGSPNVAANSLVLVVADTGNNGFSPLVYGNISTGAKIGPSFDDLIVGQIAISAAFIGTGGENVLFSSTAYSLFGDWTAGQSLAIYWIPSLNFGDTNVGLGVAYGTYTDATGLNGSAPWITPSDGSTITMLFSTNGIFGSGTVPASSGYASFSTIVPEPSTFALLGGFAALGLVAWRRRKAA